MVVHRGKKPESSRTGTSKRSYWAPLAVLAACLLIANSGAARLLQQIHDINPAALPSGNPAGLPTTQPSVLNQVNIPGVTAPAGIGNPAPAAAAATDWKSILAAQSASSAPATSQVSSYQPPGLTGDSRSSNKAGNLAAVDTVTAGGVGTGNPSTFTNPTYTSPSAPMLVTPADGSAPYILQNGRLIPVTITGSSTGGSGTVPDAAQQTSDGPADDSTADDSTLSKDQQQSFLALLKKKQQTPAPVVVALPAPAQPTQSLAAPAPAPFTPTVVGSGGIKVVTSNPISISNPISEYRPNVVGTKAVAGAILPVPLPSLSDIANLGAAAAKMIAPFIPPLGRR